MLPWKFQFPFQNSTSQSPFSNMNTDQFTSYFESMMKQFSPEQMASVLQQNHTPPNSHSASDSGLQEQIFETHEDVYVRMHIKKREWLEQMRLHYTSNQLIVSHAPEHDDEWTWTLPAIVRRKGAKATLKEDVLEIRIPKSIDYQWTEIELPPIEEI
ncbi:Hsp20/alpha crystallin family protein [Bacillus fonticola]|uniref:Hsp20/alpha crystallin family protein n=1 Tax=Bacillus fonticola TaxID=2728853 RepID=UPI0014747656|nr:Hsp20/alpha crystallin family protein [Bacillus fonticola]